MDLLPLDEQGGVCWAQSVHAVPAQIGPARGRTAVQHRLRQRHREGGAVHTSAALEGASDGLEEEETASLELGAGSAGSEVADTSLRERRCLVASEETLSEGCWRRQRWPPYCCSQPWVAAAVATSAPAAAAVSVAAAAA